MHEMSQMFYEEWSNKIKDSGHASQPESLVINKANLKEILGILQIEEVVKIDEGMNLLDFYENGTALFGEFYKDLVLFIYSTSQTTSKEDEFSKILDAFSTPSQRIIKLLVNLKQRIQ